MKTKLLLTVACLITVTARAQVITLVATNGSTPWQIVEPWQTAELISAFPDRSGVIYIEKDGITLSAMLGNGITVPVTIAGPARVKIDGLKFMATIRFTPEPYPPDKSILVPPGVGGATITLECSTNLVDWTSATNGVYTNQPVAKFFRIKADRIP